MKIHYFKSHHNPKLRLAIFPLLRPFLKNNPIADSKRKAIYHISEKEVEFVEHIEDAEICILTMSWNYYLDQNFFELAVAYVKKANLHGKKVWTWMSGDFGIPLQLKGDYVVFRSSGLKSQLSSQHLGMPVFIKDPLQEIYDSSKFSLPTYGARPIVGFCGQASAGFSQCLKEIVLIIRHILKFKLGILQTTPQPIQSTSLVRSKILNSIEKDEGVKSNFIQRKKYRAGIASSKERLTHKTTQAFFDNMLASHYILCVRGGGNFSVRFYETLAMGRIPVFVNTDCLLPLEDEIDWKKNCVWVEFEERKQIAKKVIAFHKSHTKESLFQLMKENREIWERTMRIGLFFRNIKIND